MQRKRFEHKLIIRSVGGLLNEIANLRSEIILQKHHLSAHIMSDSGWSVQRISRVFSAVVVFKLLIRPNKQIAGGFYAVRNTQDDLPRTG